MKLPKILKSSLHNLKTLGWLTIVYNMLVKMCLHFVQYTSSAVESQLNPKVLDCGHDCGASRPLRYACVSRLRLLLQFRTFLRRACVFPDDCLCLGRGQGQCCGTKNGAQPQRIAPPKLIFVFNLSFMPGLYASNLALFQSVALDLMTC